MKIKTAIETMLSDAETSMTSKVEVIQFIRKFSQPKRPITHYSCRGQSTVALKKFLELMGMTGDDFNIVSSSFDPEFNQIRWATNLVRISELVTNIANATSQIPAFFDELYAKVTNKEDFKHLTSLFCDTEVDGKIVIAPKPLDSRHIAVKILNATKSIVSVMGHTFPNGVDSVTFSGKKLNNAKIAINSAMEFLGKHFNLTTGEPISAEAPYVLPLSVLEVYARCIKGIDGPHGMRNDTLVFKTTPMAMDLFRLVRKSESLMWSACTHAPIDYLWNLKGSSTVENPLHGYFFRNSEAVVKADLDNKEGVFVGGNAALIHDEDAEDNITPAMCVSNHIDFWAYVISIYSVAYGCSAGLSCQSRIGIPVALQVWDTAHYPDCVDECLDEHETAWQELHPEAKKRSPIIAEYGLFLGKKIDHSFTDVRSFIEDAPPFKVAIVNDSRMPDFNKYYLTKEELAWEWFAMTHLDEEAGGVKSYLRTYDRGPDDETSKTAMLAFKTLMSNLKESDIARLSSCSESSLFSPRRTSDGTSYTPLSAFIEGVVMGLRKGWSPDGTSQIPFKTRDDNTRSKDHLITNVYSGVYTDMSPEIGSPEDDGSVFASPVINRPNRIIDALGDTDEQKEKFTAFLDRLGKDKPMGQVRFAKRTTSTLRRYALILETNVDAKKMLGSDSPVDVGMLETVLGTVFLQTMILNRDDPACAFDSESINNSSGYVKARNHDAMLRISRPFFSKMFTGRSDYRIPSGAYIRSIDTLVRNMAISARQDKYGRLVLIFICAGDLITYAKLAYRFRCAFPLESASIKEKTFSGFSGDTFAITEAEWNSLKMSEIVIQKHMKTRATDYNGCGSRGSAGANGDAGPLFRSPIAEFPPKCAPSRRWFMNNSTMITCGCVFDGSY